MKKLILLYFLSLGIVQISFSQSFDFKITEVGQPIILILDLTSSGEVWNETVAQLSSNFECHVPILPGFTEF